MTYGEMIRALYLNVMGGGTEEHPGLMMRVRLIEKELDDHKARTATRSAFWAMGLGCGLVPSLVVVVIEHLWK